MFAGREEELPKIPKDAVAPRLIISEQANNILIWLITY